MYKRFVLAEGREIMGYCHASITMGILMRKTLCLTILSLLLTLASTFPGVDAQNLNQNQRNQINKMNSDLSKLKQEMGELDQATKKLKAAESDMTKSAFMMMGISHAMVAPCKLNELNAKELQAVQRNVKAHGYSDKELAGFMNEYKQSLNGTTHGKMMQSPEFKTCPPEKRKRYIQTTENSIRKLDAETQSLLPKAKK